MVRLKLQQNLEKIIKFLEGHKDFVNCHMVDFLQGNHFEKFISKEIRDELKTEEEIEKAIEFFWDPEKESEFKNLSNFIKVIKSHHLDQLPDKFCLSTNQFLTKLEDSGFSIEQGLSLKIKDFLSEKKNHEVSIASAVIANLAGSSKDGLILDVGDGKGYLSSRIHLEYGLNVLGIDGNPTNTEGAQKRNTKLKKLWRGLVKREAEKSDVSIEPTDIEKNVDSNYKTVSQMIFSDTPLEPLIQSSFPGKSFEELTLVGLHTCGNLSGNSLRIFKNNESIRKFCNIGCCYHLIIEEFSSDEFFNDIYWQNNSQDVCFPMSQFLKEKKYWLGRNARMISSHSLDRVLHEKEYPNISLYYRTLFELIVKENGIGGSFKIGKIKFNNFHEYLRKSFNKFNIKIDLSDEEIDKLLEKHEIDRKRIYIFYLIRLLFAPIIEAIIILDRYLYLLENNFENSFVVKLFDPVISPRCYGIICIK